MFDRWRKKKEKKMIVNTDGDELPLDVVKQTQDMAARIGRAAVKEAQKDPSLMRVLQSGMDSRGQPGPEDVFLLYMYGSGAINAEKAISVPQGRENETYVYTLWTDNYIQHTDGDKMFVTRLGIERLQVLGVVDGKGKVVQTL